MAVSNPYRPDLMKVAEGRDETPDVRTLRLAFADDAAARACDWKPGQFGMFTVFGAGECALTIANAPTPQRRGVIECSFKLMGKVTSALRDVEAGGWVGFRGPYGNGFDVGQWRGRDLMFVGGGIGMAALRAPLQFVLDNRNDYGEILILNGARTVADLVYKQEMKQWAGVPGVKVVRTVDPGGETPDWDGQVGLVPDVFKTLAPKPNGALVITCGPPVMIRFMLVTLAGLGFAEDNIVTTLENKMKCGIGKCGRCNVGELYVCKDGPVFTAAQLKRLPKEF